MDCPDIDDTPWADAKCQICGVPISINVKQCSNDECPRMTTDYDNVKTDPHHGGKIWNDSE